MTNKSLALLLRLLADKLESEEVVTINDAKIVYEKDELLFSRTIKLEHPVGFVAIDLPNLGYDSIKITGADDGKVWEF